MKKGIGFRLNGHSRKGAGHHCRLYPFTGLLLSPMLAAAAMSLSSVTVIANALRLRNAKL